VSSFSSPQCSLAVSAYSNVTILVTDQNGDQTGYLPGTGVVTDIPGSSYSGPDSEPQVVLVPNPSGTYTIAITGTASGPYTITIGDPNTSASQTFSGTSTGASYSDTLSYTAALPLVTTPASVSATEGAPFTGQTVATFTDPDGNTDPTQYAASIDWGDGTTSSGVVTYDSATTSFVVSGDHTYSEEGAYTVAVDISDTDSSLGSASSTATVADAPLTGTPVTASSTEGAAFSGTVATFTDANPASTPTDFTATVTWGDGSPATTGTVTLVSGTYVVSASHTYAEEGAYSVSVAVLDVGGSTATVSSTGQVADAPLTAGAPVTISATEGIPFSGAVASFTDANLGAPSSDFSATIGWGDGTTSAGTVSGSGGSFSVSGTHTYGDEGAYAVTVTVNDIGGSTVDLTGTSAVADAPLTGTAAAVSSVEGMPFSGAVATFTDVNPSSTVSDFTATIDWGDGSGATLGIVTLAAGVFSVSALHVYAEEGSYAITVTIMDVGGASTTVTSTATVSDAPLIAGTPGAISSTEGSAFSGTVGTFVDSNPFGAASDFSAMVTWGDGSLSTGTVTAAVGGFEVSGGHTYSDEGTYALTITVTDVGGSTLVLSSTATVADAPLTGAATTISAVQDAAFSGAVASFSDANTNAPASDFTATITWGDGTPVSTGAVTSTGGGGFEVDGTHTYSAAGSFDIVVQVLDVGGSSASVDSTAVVTAAASTGTATCAGTSPDTCTGTPTQPGGTLTATSASTGVSVSIMGTSATGSVTITTSNEGGSAPATGPDTLLESGAAYYDVEVSGASDGMAQVCITPADGASTMQYYDGAWTPATGITFPDGSICGYIPVSALHGTSIAIGTPSSTGPPQGVPEFPPGMGQLVMMGLLLVALMAASAGTRKRYPGSAFR
jgi:hypothetical protein